jgi:hypothetical protein
MKTDRPPTEDLIRHLSAFDLRVGELALMLREVVLDEAPAANEGLYSGYALSISYSFTDKWTQGFCYIGVYRNHVNLGFIQGADLPDPQGLLQGEGKQLRHIKIKTPGDLEQNHLRRFLRAAIKLNQKELAEHQARPPKKSPPSKTTRKT